jgi:type IV secretory pathway VirB10-like protein
MSENLNGTYVRSVEKKVEKRKRRKIDEKYLIVTGAVLLFLLIFFIYGALDGETTGNKKLKFFSENRDIKAQIEEMEKKRKLVLEKEKKIADDIFMGKSVAVSDIANDIMSGLKDNHGVSSIEEKDSVTDFKSEFEDESLNNSDEDPFSDFNPDMLKVEKKKTKYSFNSKERISIKVREFKRSKISLKAYSDQDRNARIFNNGNEVIVNCISGNEDHRVVSKQNFNNSLKRENDNTRLIYNNNPIKKIFEGDFLDAVLMNRVINDIYESPVICRVVQDFYDRSGTFVLIHSNTRIIGKALPVSPRQGNRLILRFHRMIFPNGRSIVLNKGGEMSALNSEGTSGLKGRVNSHFIKRYGQALFFGFLNGIVGMAQNGVRRDGTTSIVIGRGSEHFAQLNDSVISKSMSVVPTISLSSGSTLKIYIGADIKISAYSRIDEREYFKNSSS